MLRSSARGSISCCWEVFVEVGICVGLLDGVFDALSLD